MPEARPTHHAGTMTSGSGDGHGDRDGRHAPSDTDAEPAADAETVPPEDPTPGEPGTPSHAALDLRARLIRSAARKKHGLHIDDEPGA